MNKSQKIVLIIGAIAILIQLFFFTPYFMETRGLIIMREYGNYFNSPELLALDTGRLLINWVLTGSLTFVLFLVFKDKKK